VADLDTERDPGYAERIWREIRGKNRRSAKLAGFGVDPRDWREALLEMAPGLHPGTSELIYDRPDGERIAHDLGARILSIMASARSELLITNAYIIPDRKFIGVLRELTGRGVRVRILTNSLASHDVPAVNAHYAGWRDDIVRAGAELYELRPDAAIHSVVDIPPVRGGFVGLHTKALVIDRERVFVGSMNFDPRSFHINTEAGVLVRSPPLGRALARVMERDMAPENAWRVWLDARGRPYWVSGDEVLTVQPARDPSQRVMDVFFRMFPRDQY
jgi:putative cardiolipin synthase